MITDAYTVQFLLEGTLANPPRVVWREAVGTSGFEARSGGVAVGLSETHERSGTRISMRLRRGDDVFSLHEPANQGWLRKGYTSPDDEELAGLLGRLWRAASEQNAAEQGCANMDEARTRLYRQLLFEH
jgi:hypothetical protein